MSTDLLTLHGQSLQGMDSNSLLRLYDQALEIYHHSPSHQERARADKALRRLTRELQKRKVVLGSQLPRGSS